MKRAPITRYAPEVVWRKEVPASRSHSPGLRSPSFFLALAQVARTYSHRQLVTGRVGHEDLHQRGLDWRLRQMRIHFTVIGENIAFKRPVYLPSTLEVEAMHVGLMASSGHRDNLLSPSYEWIGIGIAWIGYAMVLTQVFSRVSPLEMPTTARARF